MNEKRRTVKEAHDHINTAFKLLLTVTTEDEEIRLTRLIERLEDFIEAKHSELLGEEAGECENY